MAYCIVRPEDDDVEVYFDSGKDNIPRQDSVAYIVAPPFSIERLTRKVHAKFDDDDYENWHYFFPGDFVTGAVKCDGECTVTVASYFSSCRSSWDYKLANFTDGGFAQRDFVNVLNKKKKKYTNKCAYKVSKLFDEEGEGLINFQAEIIGEGPHYVSVTKGIFSSPTGTIDYTVSQTRINTTKSLAQCSDYECEFENITNITKKARKDTYVVVNVFSDGMIGNHEVRIAYRPSKETNDKIAMGFGIATGIAIFGIILGFLIYITNDVYNHFASSSGAKSHKSDGVEMGGETPSEKKESQPTELPATETASPEEAV